MKNIEEVKARIKNKKVKEKNINVKKINLFLTKFFIVIISFAILSIIIKKDIKIKDTIYQKVYNNNFSFAYFKNVYNTYMGNIIPFQNIFKEKKVFKEKLEYKSLSKYNKGVKLKLSDNYPIPIIKGGIVIFTGTKKDLGKTVIIQGSDGIDIWYSHLSNINVKLYDYVENNSIVGEAKNNELYMIFQKDGVEIDYNQVLK